MTWSDPQHRAGSRRLGARRPRAGLPSAVHNERIALTPQIPSTYIVATEDRTIRPDWQRRMAREWLGVEPIEIAAGHCPNVSQPDPLAQILADVS